MEVINKPASLKEVLVEESSLPVLVYSPHPLLPAADRQCYFSAFLPGETIADYLVRQGIVLSVRQPVCLLLDGYPIPVSYWHRVRPKPGVTMTLRAVVQGGGGKNPIATILTIGAFIAAPLVAPALGIVGIGAIAVTAGVRLASALVIGAIFSPSTPSGISGRALGSRPGAETVSPSYAIDGASNRARLFQPMPLVLGRHRMYPDLGAQPYTRFVGNDQYLYQVLHFGLSTVEISQLRIGNTPIEQFQAVTYQFSDSLGRLALFPARTDTVTGGTLTQANGWLTRTSALQANSLIMEFAGILYATNTDSGATETASMDLQAQYRLVGTTAWLPVLGDSSGRFSLRSSSRQALRRAYSVTVPLGQYEVQVRKTSTDAIAFNVVAQVDWAQLLTLQPDTTAYPYQTRLAMKIKASGQLNGTIDSLNALVASKIPVWDGGVERLQVSSNPGHQFIWLARGLRDEDGQRWFGAGLADTQIDLAGLREWANWCDQQQLQCNLIFDSQLTATEMLTTVARCGRASPTWASGRLGVVYDRPNQPVIQCFGMNNIKAGSFRVEYLTDNLADEIVVSFVNPALDWKPDTVRVTVPGVTQPRQSTTIELLGVTSVAQAGREANLIAARQYYHRRRISWESDLEGLVCSRGDVVTIAHDLTSWAVSGRLVSGTATELVLDRPITFDESVPYISIRAPDNTIVIHALVKGMGSTKEVSLVTPLPFSPNADPDNDPRDYLWYFAPEPTPGKKVKITELVPLDEFTVQLTAIDEVPAYYTSENGQFDYVTPTIYHGDWASVSHLRFSEDLLQLSGLTAVHIQWDLVAAYGVRLRLECEGEVVVADQIIIGTSYTYLAQGGQTLTVTVIPQAVVQVRAQLQSQTATYVVQGLSLPPEDVTGFVVTRQGRDLHFSWLPVPALDIAYYRIKQGPTWESGVIMGTVMGTHWQFSAAQGGTYLIKAVDRLGKESVQAAVIQVDSTEAINIILTQQEAEHGWAGTHDRTTVVQSPVGGQGQGQSQAQPQGQLELASAVSWEALTDTWESYRTPWGAVPAVVPLGTYITEVIDVGVALNAWIEANWQVEQVAMGITWEDFNQPWASYEGVWVGDTSISQMTVELDTSVDGITWSGFRPYLPGHYAARFYRFRLTLSTTDPIYQPVVTRFQVTVDVPDTILRFEDQPVGLGGLTLTLPQLHIIPTVQVTQQGGAIGDSAIVQKTLDQVTVQLFNVQGQPTTGLIDVLVIGY